MSAKRSWSFRRAHRIAVEEGRFNREIKDVKAAAPLQPQLSTTRGGNSSHHACSHSEPIIPKAHFRCHPHSPSWL